MCTPKHTRQCATYDNLISPLWPLARGSHKYAGHRITFQQAGRWYRDFVHYLREVAGRSCASHLIIVALRKIQGSLGRYNSISDLEIFCLESLQDLSHIIKSREGEERREPSSSRDSDLGLWNMISAAAIDGAPLWLTDWTPLFHAEWSRDCYVIHSFNSRCTKMIRNLGEKETDRPM